MGTVLSYIRMTAGNLCTAITGYFHRHPMVLTALKSAALGLVMATTAGGIIFLIGFTPAGIAAGSLAAAIQASMGSVAAGSLFSMLQSLAASGVLMPLLMGTMTPAVMVGHLAAAQRAVEGN